MGAAGYSSRRGRACRAGVSSHATRSATRGRAAFNSDLGIALWAATEPGDQVAPRIVLAPRGQRSRCGSTRARRRPRGLADARRQRNVARGRTLSAIRTPGPAPTRAVVVTAERLFQALDRCGASVRMRKLWLMRRRVVMIAAEIFSAGSRAHSPIIEPVTGCQRDDRAPTSRVPGGNRAARDA
jgi:hypothetical protein